MTVKLRNIENLSRQDTVVVNTPRPDSRYYGALESPMLLLYALTVDDYPFLLRRQTRPPVIVYQF